MAVQFKKKKLIQVFKLYDKGVHASDLKLDSSSSLHLTIDNAMSRNGKSFCVHSKYLAFRNLK